MKVRYLKVAKDQYHVWDAQLPSHHIELTLEELADFAKIGWRLGLKFERLEEQVGRKIRAVKGHAWEEGQKRG